MPLPYALVVSMVALELGLVSALNAQAPIVRDSAGVRITENPARVTFPVNLRIGGTPSLDVGGLKDNPDEEFNSSQGYLRGVRLSDGGLVVIDVNKVKFFDRTGKLLKIVGRDGDGPGEFRYITSICRTRGDTVVVGDRARLGVIDGHGNFVRHLPSTPRHPSFDACFGDGTVLLTNNADGPTPARPITELWRTHLNGTPATKLGDHNGGGFDFVTQAQLTEAASGNKLYIADANRREILQYQITLSGGTSPVRLVASIRSADPVVSITNAEVERNLAGTIPSNVTGADRTARMDRMKSLPHASTWPAFGRVHVDPAGNVWVADYIRTYPSPAGWSKFDANGRLVGRLVIPAPREGERRLEVIGFGRDDILVRRTDEDGAAHLTVYPIAGVGRP